MTYEELIKRSIKKDAFTMPEMLIAITVVGVIAALTIPSMITKRDRREWISALDKAHTILSQGFKQAQVLHNSADTWGEEKFVNNFISGFKVLETCDEGNSCVPAELYLDGDDFELSENAKSFVLADGQILSIDITDPTCSPLVGSLDGVCGSVYVDVNGSKRPNTWGKDYFAFYVTKNGIVPYGTPKIETVKEGYEWVSLGCNDKKTTCTFQFPCNRVGEAEEDCITCDGSWTPAYYVPVYGFISDKYKQEENVGTRVGATGVSHVAHCVGYQNTDTGCARHHYYGCAARSYRQDCNHYRTYSVQTPAYYTISTYSLIPQVCSGASTTYKCLAYKFVNQWDCWYDSTLNKPFNDPCNDEGVNKASCEAIKETNALKDCNLEDKGTSCASWAIMNNNMIYLDGEEVVW